MTTLTTFNAENNHKDLLRIAEAAELRIIAKAVVLICSLWNPFLKDHIYSSEHQWKDNTLIFY